MEMGKLEGKVAIITGSGGGLGRGYAMGMAKENAAIVVNDINESADHVVEEIREAGGKATAVIAEVGTKETAEKLINAAIKDLGRLDILVNNAGILRLAPLHQIDEKQWDDVINVHLRGSFLNTQAAVRYMMENEIKGRVINITAAAGMYGGVGVASYSAAKAGIIGLTMSSARELLRYGICVNAISPASRTPMSEGLPDKVREGIYKRSAQNTMQRVGEPDDVVPTVIFLASDDSYFVTGQVIAVTGFTGIM